MSQSKEGSTKKGGINYWPGKAAMESSQSQSKDAVAQPEVFSANAMEEYLKKQAEKKGKTTTPAPEPVKKDFSESSDKYTDEDFESMSRSQGAMAGLPKTQQQQPSSFSMQTRIAQTYVKKENKFS